MTGERLALRLGGCAATTAAARRTRRTAPAGRRSRGCRCCRPSRPRGRGPAHDLDQVGRHADGSEPLRIITTCVTAVVSGRTSLKLVPRPAWVLVSMRPPSALTSERTTSMPMPRPASSVTCVGRGEAGHEDQVGGVGVGELLVGGDHPLLQRLVADARPG
jgi:hypothetical protein